ncbi:hypothetical protein [Methylocystis echinoides]|uniref:hypothetical protein n=1 Tax=Methylocystis echinoides TaxID=29468 RepID=UPI00343C3F82
MSGYEHNDRHPRHNGAGSVWSLAAFSAAVFLCSLLVAKVLSEFVESERLARAGYDKVARDSGVKAEPSTRRFFTHSFGVDAVVTGAISSQRPATLSPCGEASKADKSAK